LKRGGKPHVLLVYPKTGTELESTLAPPHGILAVAAPVLAAGYRVTVLDQRVERITEELLREQLSSDLLCVGISSMTGTQIRNALNIAATVRRLTGGSVPLVWGGPHPSVMPDQTLENENADVVVIGEGDETFLELVRAIERKEGLSAVRGIAYRDGSAVVTTEPRPLLDMESLLPVPWELIDPERYVHRNNDIYLKGCGRVLDLGQTSRGCPFQCGFCSSASLRGRKWRPMSSDRALEMIREGVSRFRLDGFWLRDDEFYIDRARARRICEGIVSSGMNTRFYTAGTRVDVFLKSSREELLALYRAGARTLKFGAESGSQRILDLMKKGITVEQTLAANRLCREYGFLPSYTLLIGYPTETFADIDMTIDMGTRLKAENPDARLETMATFTAFPGTPDFSLATAHGLVPPATLEEWADWTLDDYDLEGRKLPWFSRRERKWIGNLSYLSILADSMDLVVANIGRGAFNRALLVASRPLGRHFARRLREKRYRSVPELAPARFLRHCLFQNDSPVYRGGAETEGR
jgi:radical SAM superfamily enzyme YgiQ (UPF0313 family)